MISSSPESRIVTNKERYIRRHRPGYKVLKEIRQFQKSTKLLIRKLPF